MRIGHKTSDPGHCLKKLQARSATELLHDLTGCRPELAIASGCQFFAVMLVESESLDLLGCGKLRKEAFAYFSRKEVIDDCVGEGTSAGIGRTELLPHLGKSIGFEEVHGLTR
ncbi:MAG TPA: hypothetical protein VG097_00715 [Gemmata sp.]|jgi:hypothetical protein|nr:hypothetical protein [Gemmata sp.]